MKKNLSERMAVIAANDKKVRGRFNRSLFLALRPEIDQARLDGWSIKFIWETLSKEKKIDCSYQMFTNLIKQNKQTRLQETEVTKEGLGSKTKTPPMEEASTGFNYDNRYNEEELY